MGVAAHLVSGVIVHEGVDALPRTSTGGLTMCMHAGWAGTMVQYLCF
jgi:hypothetical protein